MLTQVDKLEYTILVDNCIEWFASLPPGFTHELPQHLASSPPLDPLTGLPIVDLDNFCCGAHGLSIFITTTIGDDRFHVLMDGGPEGKSIERNVKSLKIPLQDLDGIVLSHWHRDHSGGILKALELRQSLSSSASPLPPIPVDLHPTRPIRRGIAPLPKRIPIACLPQDPTFAEIEQAGGTVDLHDETHEMLGRHGLSMGVGVSGEIPRVVPYEVGLPGAVTWMEEDGKGDWFTDELIKDERYVVIDIKGKGLVVFSSCSHAGISNVLLSAQTTHQRPINMVVGGLHLVPTHQQPVTQTIDFIARRLQPTPAFVLPLHCTGLEARGLLRNALGERCVPAGVGMRVMVEKGSEGDEMTLDGLELNVLA